jgi:acyl-CoA synthetase (NDP forming)
MQPSLSSAAGAGARALYRHPQLDRVLNPRSIAIVGASTKPGSFGDRVMNNLAEFAGEIYLVNAKYERLGERRCHPSLSALPVAPDCVVITIPRDAAEDVVREAAAIGAGGAILFASGYAETQLPERIAQQQRLTGIARDMGLRIIGPNCLGIANYVRRARVTFSEFPRPRELRGLSVGIASQSGALSQSLAQSIECGASVSHVFSAGNQCDVDVADLVAYLAEDPSCKAIACAFEGMSDPQRLLEAAQIAWDNDKPLLINKIATGRMGAEAAISHTGSLAGSDVAYRAAFERIGAVVIDDFEGLMEAAAFFAKAPAPKARGVAVLATSGGAAIMAADKAEMHGVALPQPGDATRLVLEAHVPDFGSARNPCDVTAQVVNNPESLWACGEALLSDPAYGVLIVPQPVAFEFHKPRITALSELSRLHGKITCNVLISGWLQGPGALEAEVDPHVALFRSMDRCIRVLAAWHHRADLRLRGPRRLSRLAPAHATNVAADLIGTASSDKLTERESKAVLDLYGVPTVQELLAESAEAAVDGAAQVGFPIVLKIESPDIAHKTEAGGVALNITSVAELRNAFCRIVDSARAYAPAARIKGVLVQPMISAGVEMVVGARVDPALGPLIMLGFGGVLVELLRDTVVELAPVNSDEALNMLRRLKGAALLNGFRGAPAVDLAKLAEVVVRISELVADQRAIVAEIDVNPIICSPRRAIAVDALIVRST